MRISDWSSDVCSSDLQDSDLGCSQAIGLRANDLEDLGGFGFFVDPDLVGRAFLAQAVMRQVDHAVRMASLLVAYTHIFAGTAIGGLEISLHRECVPSAGRRWAKSREGKKWVRRGMYRWEAY